MINIKTVGYYFELLNSRIIILKNRFRGYLIKYSLGASYGPISIGSSCNITGKRNIYCLGRFTAQNRNRIQTYERHRGLIYSPNIIFGDNFSMEDDCHIAAIGLVEFHSNILLGSKVYISDHSHGDSSFMTLKIPPFLRPVISKGPVVIESNVWIGEGSAILPGVRIGKNSIVGANSVVTKDIPPNSVVGGVPARVIRTLATD